MKNAIALAAVAGIASAAAAQTATLNIVASQSVVNSQTTSSITLSVFASADFGTHIVGGGFALDATGGAGVVGAMAATPVAWGAGAANDRGDGGDGNYIGLVFGQTVFPDFGFPPNPASDFTGGEVLVATFSVEILAGSSGVVDWSTAVDALSQFTLQIFDGGDNSSTVPASFNFGSTGAVNVVPAPSAMALLGLGGLVAGRRRR